MKLHFLKMALISASLLFFDFAEAKQLQNSDLPEIVVTQFPPTRIEVSRSDFSLSSYVSDPFTLEVQIQDSDGAPVLDNHFGPNTHFEATLTFTNGRGELITGATETMTTVDGIARFESISLLVSPDVYDLEVTINIIFAIEELGQTYLTLGSVSLGSLIVGVDPTATPSPTATINPYAGTPPAALTLQYFATANAPAAQTLQAQLDGVSTALATTPQPTQFCPPNDPFNCNFPTSTATLAPSATLSPIIAQEDRNFTLNVPIRGISFQNDVSGPRGDTSDTIDLQFSLLEITQPTTFSVSLTCTGNTSAAASILSTGVVVTCGGSSPITASSFEAAFRVIVTTLSTREQTRTPYVLSISPSR
jgi:hypothetical protein